MTERIRNLTIHFAKHKQDKHGGRGFQVNILFRLLLFLLVGSNLQFTIFNTISSTTDADSTAEENDAIFDAQGHR